MNTRVDQENYPTKKKKKQTKKKKQQHKNVFSLSFKKVKQ